MHFSINQLVFVNNLYEIRKRENKTASEVANFLCISRMQYYRYERDLCPVPAKVVLALAYYYDCIPDSLYFCPSRFFVR